MPVLCRVPLCREVLPGRHAVLDLEVNVLHSCDIDPGILSFAPVLKLPDLPAVRLTDIDGMVKAALSHGQAGHQSFLLQLGEILVERRLRICDAVLIQIPADLVKGQIAAAQGKENKPAAHRLEIDLDVRGGRFLGALPQHIITAFGRDDDLPRGVDRADVVAQRGAAHSQIPADSR